MEMERNNEARVRADFIYVTRAVLYNAYLSKPGHSAQNPSISVMGIFQQLTKEPDATIDDDDEIH